MLQKESAGTVLENLVKAKSRKELQNQITISIFVEQHENTIII
jgi:hypothetical protein